MPRFSGTKDLATSTTSVTTYRNTVAKEKYKINQNNATEFKDISIAKGDYLSIDLNDRQDVREILLYTDITTTSLNVVFDVNATNEKYGLYSSTPVVQYRSRNDNGYLGYASVAVNNGVVRLILPYDVKSTVGGASVSAKVDNILIGFTSAVNKIYDIEVVSLTTPDNQENITKNDIYQYSNYHFVNYDTAKPAGTTNPTNVENQCKSKVLKSTEVYNDKCIVEKLYYNYDYDFDKVKPEHYGTKLTDDYEFKYLFSPTEYTINYYIEESDTTPSNKTVFAIEETAKATEYKKVTLMTPEKTGYTFKGWKEKDSTKVITTANINSGSSYMKNYELVAQWQANAVVVKYLKGTTETTGTSWGSTATKTVNTTYDSTYAHPALTWTGHTFIGWFDKDGNEIRNGDIVKTTESTYELTAGWDNTYYTLRLDLLGGTTTSPTTIGNLKYNDTYYEQLPTPEREGYDFSGWYTAETGGTKIVATSKFPASDTTLYARWIGHNITVSFNENGGDKAIAAVSKKVGLAYGKNVSGAAAVLPTPTRVGYTFAGWYLGSGDNAVMVDNTTVINTVTDHTLVAHWTPNKYDVTLDLNKGTGSTTGTLPNNITKITATYDDTYSHSTVNGETVGLPTPERYGYNFEGWFTTKTYTEEIKADTKVNITAAKTYYAKWSPKVINVTVNYNKGGSLGPVKQIEFDQAYNSTDMEATPKRTDYTFNGWFVNLNGTETKVTLGTTKVTIAEAHEIYAKWTGNKVVVTYDGNGGKFGSYATKNVDNYYGGNYIFPPAEPTYAGHKFEGWYTNDTGGAKRTEEDVLEKTTAHTLYAHWSVEKYKVTFNSMGGSNVDGKEFEYNEKLGELPTPTRTGYTFDAWYTTETYTSTTKVSATTAVTKDMTLYAKWNPVSVVITYDSNGGSAVANATKKYGDAYGTLPAPTKTGYTLDGWYKENTFKNKVESTSVIDSTSNYTLYAKWNPNEFNIKLNLNGGTASTVDYVATYGENYPSINTPTKVGYTFKGWFKTATGTEKYNLDEKVNLTVANGSTINIYAQWDAKSVKISYDANGGSEVSKVDNNTYDQKYTTLPTTTRAGYTFAGWYDAKEGGNKITAGTTVIKIEADHTLYAHWTPNNYIVTFNKNGGTISGDSITVAFGSKYEKLPVTGTKNGYIFDGWKDNNGNVVTNDSIYSNVGNQVLAAQWKLEEYTITYGDKTIKYTIESDDFTLEEPTSPDGVEFLGFTGNGITTPTKTVTIKKGTTGNLTYDLNWKNPNTGESIVRTQLSSKSGQSVSDYVSKNPKYKKILNKDKSAKANGDLIKTGDIAIDAYNFETVIIVTMDVSGDGKINTLDYVKVWNHLDKSNPNNLDGDENKYSRMAADVNGDNKITTLDYVKIWNTLSK